MATTELHTHTDNEHSNHSHSARWVMTYNPTNLAHPQRDNVKQPINGLLENCLLGLM